VGYVNYHGLRKPETAPLILVTKNENGHSRRSSTKDCTLMHILAGWRARRSFIAAAARGVSSNSICTEYLPVNGYSHFGSWQRCRFLKAESQTESLPTASIFLAIDQQVPVALHGGVHCFRAAAKT
jgi:hypothetical protein